MEAITQGILNGNSMKCESRNCKNEAVKHRKLCPKHRSREYKKNHFPKYTFNALKQNAKRRNKPFKLSYNEFLLFCESTEYLFLKGKDAESLSIDRIDDSKGYSYDNIRAITLKENIIKERSKIPF